MAIFFILFISTSPALDLTKVESKVVSLGDHSVDVSQLKEECKKYDSEYIRHYEEAADESLQLVYECKRNDDKSIMAFAYNHDEYRELQKKIGDARCKAQHGKGYRFAGLIEDQTVGSKSSGKKIYKNKANYSALCNPIKKKFEMNNKVKGVTQDHEQVVVEDGSVAQ